MDGGTRQWKDKSDGLSGFELRKDLQHNKYVYKQCEFDLGMFTPSFCIDLSQSMHGNLRDTLDISNLQTGTAAK